MNARYPAVDTLRTATREAHATLEKTLEITKPHAGREEYIDYLETMFGWLDTFETNLWSAPWPGQINSSDRGKKCEWIIEDLRKAGMNIEQIPRSPFSPDLTRLPGRIGLAYVIEGSQLGTKVLMKSLAHRLNGWAPRWLVGYGEHTGRYWREFLSYMEAHLQSLEDRRAAAAAAEAAFVSLSAWFEIRERARHSSAPSAPPLFHIHDDGPPSVCRRRVE